MQGEINLHNPVDNLQLDCSFGHLFQVICGHGVERDSHNGQLGHRNDDVLALSLLCLDQFLNLQDTTMDSLLEKRWSLLVTPAE